MPTTADPTKKTEVELEQRAEQLTREDVQAMVSGAFKDSQKRTEKLIRDSLATALADFKPAEPTEPAVDPTKNGGSASWKDSLEYKAMQKELADTRKRVEDSEKRAKAEVEARRHDTAKAELRKHFEGANVRPEALDVLVAAATVNGMLRFDEEGKPLVAVKRSRAKDAAAEEQVFEDFKQGVSDWAKSPEAAAFMKPPSTQNAGGKRTTQGTTPTYTKEPASDEEAAGRVLDLLNEAPV